MNMRDIIRLVESTTVNQQLLTIAGKCRDQLERYVSQMDPTEYVPDQHELDCFCAISSMYLYKTLRSKKISCSFVMGQFNGNDHCWVEVSERIVDLTATQFDLSLAKVHITEVGDPNYVAEFRDAAAIRTLNDWPKEQRMQRGMLKVLRSF